MCAGNIILFRNMRSPEQIKTQESNKFTLMSSPIVDKYNDNHFAHTPLLHNVSSLFCKHSHYWLPLSMVLLLPLPPVPSSLWNIGSGNFSSYTNTYRQSIRLLRLISFVVQVYLMCWVMAQSVHRVWVCSSAMHCRHIPFQYFCWHLNNIKNDMYKSFAKASRISGAYTISVNEEWTVRLCALPSPSLVAHLFVLSTPAWFFFPPISIRPFFLFAVAIAVDFYFECELWVVTICTCNVFTSDGQPHLCMGCDVCVCSRETRESQSNRINEKCKSNIC